MVKKQTDEKEAREARRTHFEANSVSGLVTVITDSNQKIKELEENKREALDVLTIKMKDVHPEKLLVIRDNRDNDADVRWAAGFVLSVEHGIRHNP